VSVQGAADMAMSFFGGLAGFASGFIRKAVGYHVLSTFALALAVLLAGAALLRPMLEARGAPKGNPAG
jgi:hypothetical protein